MDDHLRGDEIATGIPLGFRTWPDTEFDATAEPTVDDRSGATTGDRDDGT